MKTNNKLKSFLFALFVMNLCTSMSAQTIYSTAFGGFFPSDILIIDNYLYAGEISGESIARINLTSSSPTRELVADGWLPGSGVWKLAYDQSTNILYGGGFLETRTVDLDLSLPATSADFSATGIANGLAIHNNILYKGTDNTIYSIDLSAGPGSYAPYFEEPFGDPGNFVVIGDALYYCANATSTGPRNAVYKIDLSAGSPSRELVAELALAGSIQSMHNAGDYLYVGLEGDAGTDFIYKLDLTETALPISEETVLSDIPAAPLGIANQGETFYLSLGDQLIYTFEDAILSSPENDSISFSLYPNPTSEVVRISTSMGSLEYKLISIDGRFLSSGTVVNNGMIDLSTLSSGVYFVEIIHQNSKVVRRVVKQ